MIKSFFISALLFTFFTFSFGTDLTVYVSPNGNDKANGIQRDAPKKSIAAAIVYIKANRSDDSDTARVMVLPGEYYLETSIKITAEHGPLSIEAQDAGSAVIKGSKLLKGEWKKYREHIVKLKTDMQISLMRNCTLMELSKFWPGIRIMIVQPAIIMDMQLMLSIQNVS